MSCIGYLFMTYTLGQLVNRTILNTILTGIGFVCYIIVIAFFFADTQYLQKMLNVDFGNGEMWGDGAFDKTSIWPMIIFYEMVPPLQFFLGYYLELLRTA